MKNETIKGEPEPEIREKAHDKKRVEEALRDGARGILIASEVFSYYYFFSDDEEECPSFKIKRLYKLF